GRDQRGRIVAPGHSGWRRKRGDGGRGDGGRGWECRGGGRHTYPRHWTVLYCDQVRWGERRGTVAPGHSGRRGDWHGRCGRGGWSRERRSGWQYEAGGQTNLHGDQVRRRQRIRALASTDWGESCRRGPGGRGG